MPLHDTVAIRPRRRYYGQALEGDGFDRLISTLESLGSSDLSLPAEQLRMNLQTAAADGLPFELAWEAATHPLDEALERISAGHFDEHPGETEARALYADDFGYKRIAKALGITRSQARRRVRSSPLATLEAQLTEDRALIEEDRAIFQAAYEGRDPTVQEKAQRLAAAWGRTEDLLPRQEATARHRKQAA
jgi:hypothetical protein